MNEMLIGTGSSGKSRLYRWSAVGLSLLVALVLCRPVVGQGVQQIEVSGTVKSPSGELLAGVTITVRGTSTTTVTDERGRYTLIAPSDGVLVLARIGYRGVGQAVSGRTTVNIVMEPSLVRLPDVVVTGYQEQRRADITGAISTVAISTTVHQTPASVLKRLDSEVSGVTVETGGSPGARSTVRIRGVSSFQNNDPLYIVDGTPLQDSYLNWLNPDDIESMSVLKDASAASIYGAQAGNGVIIIRTKRGSGQRKVTLDVRTGVSTPVRGLDSYLTLNSLDYFKVVRTAYQNAGLRTPLSHAGSIVPVTYMSLPLSATISP